MGGGVGALTGTGTCTSLITSFSTGYGCQEQDFDHQMHDTILNLELQLLYLVYFMLIFFANLKIIDTFGLLRYTYIFRVPRNLESYLMI